jgi:hypothetical protein
MRGYLVGSVKGAGSLLFLAHLWLSAALAQEVVQVPDSLVCACHLEVEHVVTLTDFDGRAGLSRPLAVERTFDGHYLVVPSSRQGAVLLFDSTGSYAGLVGRPGQGPGEFGAVLAIRPGRGDSIVIMDAGNGRLAVLDRDFRPSRVARAPVVGGWFGVLEDGRILILTGIPGSGAPSRDRLRLLSPSMEQVASFMPGTASGPGSSVAALRRRMFVSKSGTVAVSHNDRYVVEIWNVSGRHLSTLSRNPEWFRLDPLDRPTSSAQAPAPLLEAPRLDGNGRLWSVSHIADQEWATAVSTVPDLYGRAVAGVEEADRDGYQDSVVEVIDVARGVLLGSVRIDPQVAFISNDGFAASYREDLAGNPVIDVWRFVLAGNSP